MAIESLQCKPTRAEGAQPETFNIASYLPRMAAAVPDQAAVIVPYRQYTFAELEAESNRCANGLEHAGIERGDRVIVMVKPGLEFFALIFALFKMGAVPVMIDPGMGMTRMVDCIAQVQPHAFIGIPLAQLMRVIHRRRFPTLQTVVRAAGFSLRGRTARAKAPRLAWGGHTLRRLCDGSGDTYVTVPTRSDEPAAILFTTGSTGPPKGVEYEHGVFHAQVMAIQSHYGIEPGEVDLPAFPLFALFSTAMGMTCVIPDMDPSRPARVDPARIVRAIRDHNVTNTFGSPAIWRKVGRYCVERGVKLPTLRRVLMAGAPVSWQVLEDMRAVLSVGADVHTPYGATESLPVSSISGRALLDGGLADRARRGEGTCVGQPSLGTQVRLIKITDEPIEHWSDELLVPDGRRGEIVVGGPVVTRRYFNQPEATALHKICDGDSVWHRIGDVGYRDEDGRLWFCGRKVHRVKTGGGTLFTVECEAIFNEHPDVFRSALVGIGPRGLQTPVIIVEPRPGKFPRGKRKAAFTEALLELGEANERTRTIRNVLFHRSFPVDIRHNAKIFREKLAVWAAERQRSTLPSPA